jgi:hypothetical protein
VHSAGADEQANYIQTLHQLLEGTIAPDTNVIKAVSTLLQWQSTEDDTDPQATTQLNTQFYKNSQCIPGLYQIAVSSDNQAVSRAQRSGKTSQAVTDI